MSLEQELLRVQNKHVSVERPPWHIYFLDLAKHIATRSIDARTKVGCVLTTSNNEIISTGYNSYIRNIDDSILPNYDSSKLDYMIHAEVNAILNAARQGKSTMDAIVYLTGHPCFSCLQYMWQAGIRKVYHYHQDIKMLAYQQDSIALFKYLTNNKLEIITIDI